MSCKIGMVSLGCAKNQTDAETMLGILADNEYEIVNDPAEADVIIVNTCGFIEAAKTESIGAVLEMADYKKTGKCRALIVTGCLAERYHSEMLSEMPEVDAVLGTGDYDGIAEAVKSALGGGKPVIAGHIDRTPDDHLPRILTTPPYTAYLKIADGCDNRCTYCAIPMIRGRFRSRTIESVVSEARELAENGVKELILIAQDTTRYGKDIYGKYALADLLRELAGIENIHWIRTHYFYTEAVTDELINVMAENEKILPYIDMPIQHASNRILKRMARRTSKEQIRERIAKIREAMPDAVIRTSIIAGFPGETDEDFQELCDFIKEIRFDRMGVFTYSQEEDTPAAEFEDQIPEDVKLERRDILMSIQQEISLEKNRERLGTEIEVLCEGYDEDNWLYVGRSRGDSIDVDGRVYFGAEREVSAGEFVTVKIAAAEEYDLSGEETEARQ